MQGLAAVTAVALELEAMIGYFETGFLSYLLKGNFKFGRFVKVDNLLALETDGVMMVPLKYLTQLDLVFPPNRDFLGNVQFFKEFNCAIDTGAIARIRDGFGELCHTHAAMFRECAKYCLTRLGETVAIALEN